MKDDSGASAAHVIEECFVRALAVVLSGGDDERLKFHAGYGFTSVPHIASYIRSMQLSYINLVELVSKVLKEVRILMNNVKEKDRFI
jgi:hypothetical protein